MLRLDFKAIQWLGSFRCSAFVISCCIVGSQIWVAVKQLSWELEYHGLHVVKQTAEPCCRKLFKCCMYLIPVLVILPGSISGVLVLNLLFQKNK